MEIHNNQRRKIEAHVTATACDAWLAELAAPHFETAEIQTLVAAAKVVYCAGFFLTVSPPTMVALGKHVGVYSGRYSWPALTGNTTAFDGLPLWYAHYEAPMNPSFSDYGDGPGQLGTWLGG